MIVGDCRHIGGLAETGNDLLANRFVARVDVVEMDRRRVCRLHLPEVGDRTGQQAQHAPHALEIAEGRGLAGEGCQHLRMQRIARTEGLRALRVRGVPGQRVSMRGPQLLVGVDHRGKRSAVDGLEQAPEQYLDGLVLFGGVEQGGLARGHALRLRHPVADELVLLAVGVGGAAILANRQGVDQRRVRRAFHRLEQRGQERGQLIAGGVKALHLAQIDRQLVEQDQGRLSTEQLAQGFGTGRDALLVAPANPFVAGLAGERIGDLAPRRMGQNAVAHRSAVGGIRVLAVEPSHAHGPRRQQARVDELRDV